MAERPKAPPKPRAHPPSPPPSNPRIFELQAYHPGESSSTSELSSAYDLILYDSDTHLSNTLFYAQTGDDHGDTRTLKIGEPKEDEIVVCIAGVYRANGADPRNEDGTSGKKGRAACGIFFGPESKFNVCGKMPSSMRQTLQSAELSAAKAAVRVLSEKILKEIKSVKKLVICTHSKYVVDGLSKNVWKWEGTGYVTTRADDVVDGALFEEIHTSILDLEGRNISVELWAVRKWENKLALELAEGVFEITNTKTEEEEDKNMPAPSASASAVRHSAAWDYWLNEAASESRAQNLCSLANIQMWLPAPSASASTSALVSTSAKSSEPKPASLNCILERLINLDLDTPENLELLFGPEWHAGVKRVLGKKRAQIQAEQEEELPSLI
jgi:ribonuclease HI